MLNAIRKWNIQLAARVYYEAYLAEKDARERERMLKHYGASLGHLKARIRNSMGRALE